MNATPPPPAQPPAPSGWPYPNPYGQPPDPYGPGPHPPAPPAPPGRGRRVGCLLSPFTLAWRVFLPSRPDRVVDPAIARARIGRMLIGVIATIWLFYAYPLQDSVGDVASDKFDEVVYSASVLFVSVPVALLVFVLAAGRAVRRTYLRRSLGPLGALGALFGGFAFVVFFGTGVGKQLMESVPLVTLPLAPVMLFAIPFVVVGAALGATTVFRTADVHDVLPPLISPALVCAMFVIQLFDSPPVEAPLAVRLLFLIAPPVSVLGLTFWELRRLRTHHGLTVRAALRRA